MASKMNKRTNTDGTTTWHTVVDVGVDPRSGKRRQRRLSAATKAELQRDVTKTLAAVDAGGYVDGSKDRLSEYLTSWLDATAADVRPTTARTYQYAIDRHIAPHLGAHRLKQLQPLHVQAWLTAEQKAGASPVSISIYLAVLKKAMRQAVAWGMVTRTPCDGISPPRIARSERITWTADQARTFLDTTANDELAAYYRLALTLGIRIGEALALTWSDIDPKAGALTIARTVTRTRDGKQSEGETKTASSRRRLALPAACIAALKRHKARQTAARLAAGPLWRHSDHVFTDAIGRPYDPSAVRRRLASTVTTAGVPRLAPHGLRHTAATLALEAGEAPKVVQQQLGHSSIAMTLGVYGHVTSAMEAAATERLDRLFG